MAQLLPIGDVHHHPMLERKDAFVSPLWRERRYSVESEEDSRAVASRIAPELCRGQQVEMVGGAIGTFTDALLRTAGVDGIAFLSTRDPRTPTTLALRVLARFGTEAEPIANIRAISRATAQLTEQIAPALPSGLRFVSTDRCDVACLEPRLRQRWSAGNPPLQLHAFVVFQRP